MPTSFRVGNMRFVINTREAKTEKPHCHVYSGSGKGEKDAKIWLKTLKPAYWGTYSKAERRDIRAIVKGAKRKLMADWIAVHGKPSTRG